MPVDPSDAVTTFTKEKIMELVAFSGVKDPFVKPRFVGVFLQINYLKQTQISTALDRQYRPLR